MPNIVVSQASFGITLTKYFLDVLGSHPYNIYQDNFLTLPNLYSELVNANVGL